MQESRYSLEKLRKHSESVRLKSLSLQKEQQDFIEKAFADFSENLAEIEQQPPTLERNVKLILACKLFNHVYSGFILAERGLIVNAVLCERNALETIAFHWLVSLDGNALHEYEQGNVPRPVEVRRRLEKLGVDVENIRSIYASGSEISHVGRESERFHSRWESSFEGRLLFGGDFAPDDQAEMFRFLPALLYLFHQPSTVV
ncbi:MAG: hypothetical protein KME27_16470 [Lyngbya sp. HA4199-MV5]|jgi:hypothetical protein|nr:hypothetical protein [Lyngbya sp. HA4199-MV5]